MLHLGWRNDSSRSNFSEKTDSALGPNSYTEHDSAPSPITEPDRGPGGGAIRELESLATDTFWKVG